MTSSETLSVAFYDQLGAEGLAARTKASWDRRILARTRRMLTPGQRILDLGCGYGRIAVPLAQAGFDVTGIDVSRSLLRAARRRAREGHASVRWICASMCRMPLADKSFDVALCLWSAFHELLAESEQAQAVGEIWRVLRPGGWCLIEGGVFRAATAKETAAGLRCGPDDRVSMDRIGGLLNPHFHHDPRSLARLMTRAGIAAFSVYDDDWAGRTRQFLRFEKSHAQASGPEN